MTASFERSNDVTGDDWAWGYVGVMYAATINSTEPFSLLWEFGGFQFGYDVDENGKFEISQVWNNGCL